MNAHSPIYLGESLLNRSEISVIPHLTHKIVVFVMYRMDCFLHAVLRTGVLICTVLCLMTMTSSGQEHWRISGNAGIDWFGSDLNSGLVLGYTPMVFGQIQVDFLAKNFAFPRNFVWLKGGGFLVAAEFGRMYAQDASSLRHSQNTFGTFCVGVQYRFLQNGPLNPLVFVKGGILYATNIKYVGWKPQGFRTISSTTCGVVCPGFGIEYILRKIVFNARVEVMILNSDQLDGYVSGRKMDGVTGVSVGAGIPF
jgi:hypothetical protein